MQYSRRLPRPVRKRRRMVVRRIIISGAALRKIRELARAFRTTPDVVLGLYLYFGLTRRTDGAKS